MPLCKRSTDRASATVPQNQAELRVMVRDALRHVYEKDAPALGLQKYAMQLSSSRHSRMTAPRLCWCLTLRKP